MFSAIRTRGPAVMAVALAAGAFSGCGAVPNALAQAADGGPPEPKYAGIRDDSLALSLPTPDPLDHRRMLFDRGVSYELNYVFDVLGNVSGGRRRGTVYSGRTEAVLDLNLRTLFGLADDPAHATIARINGYHIHGGALSRSYIGNLAPVSNIEAFPAIRLFEAWVQQSFGPLSIRAGQLGSDSETAGSSTAGQFNNGTFGWPALNAGNILSGGPAYPLATPGITVKYDLAASGANLPLSILIGLYNGDPSRPGLDDPQRRNRHGLDFRLRHGALYATEVKYDAGKGSAYAGSYKVGGWYHSGRFEDRRLGTDGLSLADPTSNGTPLRHRGNYGFYAIADQIVLPADKDGLGQLSVFGRVFHSPLRDRNLLSWQVDAGVVAKGLFGRASNSAGIAVSYMKVAGGPRAFDRDFASFNGGGLIRSHEIAVEANYLFEVRRGFTLQPSVQYIARPGGYAANPLAVGAVRPIRNATVLGLRGVVKY